MLLCLMCRGFLGALGSTRLSGHKQAKKGACTMKPDRVSGHVKRGELRVIDEQEPEHDSCRLGYARVGEIKVAQGPGSFVTAQRLPKRKAACFPNRIPGQVERSERHAGGAEDGTESKPTTRVAVNCIPAHIERRKRRCMPTAVRKQLSQSERGPGGEAVF